MNTSETRLTPLERVLSLGADVHPGEGRNIILLFMMLFMLLTTAYILKPVREMLILTEGGAEVRSYAVALQALLLIFIIPVYSHFSRRISKFRFMLFIIGLFVLNFLLFVLLGHLEVQVSIMFFVWLGAYGVLILSQFWAFVSEQYDQKSGERLLALIAFGASIGAWFGAALSRWLVTIFGPYEMMLLGATTLSLSAIPVFFLRHHGNNNVAPEPQQKMPVWDAFKMIFRNRYLLLVAMFVILLNWLNSTGEFILSSLVVHFYEQGMQQDQINVTKEVFIGQFYSDFFLTVNIAGALIQFFVVSRVVNYFGLRIAILITPLIVLSGYTLLLLFPAIAFFKILKIAENSLDYSLQNTARQILYLPTSRREKYEARAVIDTFCWRFGDLIQAGVVFVGINWLAFDVFDFVELQIPLAALFVTLAFVIGRRYVSLSRAAAPANTNAET